MLDPKQTNIATRSEQYVNNVNSHSPKGLANLTSRTFREREVVSCNIRKKSVASNWEGEAPAEPRSTCQGQPLFTGGREPLHRKFCRLSHALSVAWPSALRPRPPCCVTRQFVKNFASSLRFPLEKTSHRLDKMVHICEIAVEYPAELRLPNLPNRKLS